MSTSDSVDRVFVHALATVRRLPRTGSSRPPPSARLRLYGLYKQSMEGDVSSILPRPTLPPLSPGVQSSDPSASHNTSNDTEPKNGNNSNNTNANAVHRYASRDLRTREAQAEIEKWDAWHACAGMSRTEAKRRYISTLIETMKEYASGTSESRELVGELEFVWGQIESQSQSGGSGNGNGSGRASGGNGSGSGGSPKRSGVGRESSFMEGGGGRPRFERNETTDTRMRVLSPVSQRDSDDPIEGEEDPIPEPDARPDTPRTDPQWRTSIEAHLRRLSTEIAALREQLSSNHLLSSSSYSPYTYHQLSLKWKIWYRISTWVRWMVWAAVRQASVNAVLLGLLFVWSKWRGDRKIEEWARRRWKEIRSILGRLLDSVDLRRFRDVLRLRAIS